MGTVEGNSYGNGYTYLENILFHKAQTRTHSESEVANSQEKKSRITSFHSSLSLSVSQRTCMFPSSLPIQRRNVAESHVIQQRLTTEVNTLMERSNPVVLLPVQELK